MIRKYRVTQIHEVIIDDEILADIADVMDILPADLVTNMVEEYQCGGEFSEYVSPLGTRAREIRR